MKHEEIREDVTWRWEQTVNEIISLNIDKEKTLKLIFDTYNYFREGSEYNSILRSDLPIYRYISEAYAHLCHEYSDSIKMYEQDALLFTIEGLYWAIDTGFERGYYRNSLKAGVSNHELSYEIDMTDYGSFIKGFSYLTGMIRDTYDEEEEE